MKKRGFTLIELLVVIAIIGILASIVLVSVGGSRKNANAVKAKADLNQMMTALELANSGGCGATTYVLAAGNAIACSGDTLLQSTPAAPSGIAYAFFKNTGCTSSGNPTAEGYCLRATGFSDAGTFDCIGGSCFCSSPALCLK